MFVFYFSIALAVLSNVFYHIFQKWTPLNVNPLVALTVTYLTAAAICGVLLAATGTGGVPLAVSLRQLNWASVGLGLAIVGLEMGFLLAYRAGWKISLAQLAANTLVAVILIPVGLALFREKLSPLNLAGIVICLIGLVIVNWK